MKVDDAKTKWCPMARVRTDKGCGYNRYFESEDGSFHGGPGVASKCLADGCAMWVWEKSEEDRFGHFVVWEELKKRGYRAGNGIWGFLLDYKIHTWQGLCDNLSLAKKYGGIGKKTFQGLVEIVQANLPESKKKTDGQCGLVRGE